MSIEARVRSLSLFFFFAALDEKFSLLATFKSFQRCQKRIRQGSLPEGKWPVVMVHVTHSYYNKLKQAKNKPAAISYEAGWLIPEGIDLGPWMEFQKESELDEFLAVLWSKILNISDEDISEGLGLTVGTVRHRIARGLVTLGSVYNGEYRK